MSNKVVFVEVRDKTLLFNEVAKRLQSKGLEIHWIVQNKMFSKRLIGKVHQLPYPRKCDLVVPKKTELYGDVISTDRFIYLFGSKGEHYDFYWNKIYKVLLDIEPDYVFGEIGNFHTHMVSIICEMQGIKFFNPIGCRYPTGRFSFYKYDKFVPTYSGDLLSHEEINTLVDDIVERKIKPDYMNKKDRFLFFRKAIYKINVLINYLRGERFATQSPIANWKLNKDRKLKARLWEQAATKLDYFNGMPKSSLVLYPMQMQPEFNLDVWGKEHNDQTQLLKMLMRKEKGKIYLIKPNPKSFFEISDELIELSKSERIFLLHHDTKMKDVLEVVSSVVTVTGTIALEQILSGQEVTILGKDYAAFLQDGVKSPADLLAKLVATSYTGIIGEPINMPFVMSEENLSNVTSSFLRFIESENGKY